MGPNFPRNIRQRRYLLQSQRRCQHIVYPAGSNVQIGMAQHILAQLAQSDSEESRQKEKLLKRKWEDINGVITCRLGVRKPFIFPHQILCCDMPAIFFRPDAHRLRAYIGLQSAGRQTG